MQNIYNLMFRMRNVKRSKQMLEHFLDNVYIFWIYVLLLVPLTAGPFRNSRCCGRPMYMRPPGRVSKSQIYVCPLHFTSGALR